MMRILVLGGGAAGMMAAWRAATSGHQVCLLEGNGELAVKVRMSGGGKCNLTHEGRVEALLKAFPKEQARFLKYAFHTFSNDDLRALFHREGLETYVRENGRVFPEDGPGTARQVVQVFRNLLQTSGVELRLGQRAVGLEVRTSRISALQLESGASLGADLFILATGGASYPETGTRGEVLNWLEAQGIPVKPWFPALAPIPLRTPRPAWEGLAFRHGALRLLAGRDGRRLAEGTGDLVFTRNGISGPAALEMSEASELARREGGAWLAYAFTEARSEDVDQELRNEQQANPHLAARNWLHRWIPERAIESAMSEAGISGEQRLKDLTRKDRKSLVELVTAFPLGEIAPVPLERGEVAAGGVRLDNLDPRTMAVKGWENLRVCGELLDIHGPIGGFNLQAAFSTGYVAGTV